MVTGTVPRFGTAQISTGGLSTNAIINSKERGSALRLTLKEDEIKAAFVKAVNQLLKSKDDMLENIRLVREQICDTADLEVESQQLMEEMKLLSDMVQKCISENARIAQDQSDYQKRYNELVSR